MLMLPPPMHRPRADRDVMVIGPEGTLYEGGFFNATLTFPLDYPQNPPKMTFTSEIWHPNVYYPSGEVCISILHPPGKGVGRGRGACKDA